MVVTEQGARRVLRAMDDPTFRGILNRLPRQQDRLLENRTPIIKDTGVSAENPNGFFPNVKRE